MSFDKIVSHETLELKSTKVTINGSDGKKYNFTVKELTPAEQLYCLDEYGKPDILAIIRRSVWDEAGSRMTVEQSEKLSPELLGKFLSAYDSLVDSNKKKSLTKKSKKSQ